MSLAIALNIALTLTLPGATAAGDADWPHLRGPGHDGHITSSVFEGRDFALEVAWKKTLGSGYSGIAVADGTLVTMGAAGESDVVVALDAATGEERWRHALGPAYRGHDGSLDGPLSTPLIYRGVAYALAPRGTLFALDMADGRVLWSRDLVGDFGSIAPDYGFTTTPIAEGDVLIVQAGGPEGHSLCGLDVRTGERRWSTGDEPAEYQSPIVMTLAGRRHLVAFREGVLAGHDPASGKVLWQHELGPRDSAGSAVPGRVDESRFLALLGGSLVVFEVRKTDGGFEVEEVMRSRELGGTYAPPVRVGDHFYGFRRDFLTCVDARSGERVWKSRPPGGKGLIVVNDHLVIFGARGRVVVAAASPEGYREEASLEVFDRSGFTWPSFADGRIYVRNPMEIAALGVTKHAGPTTTARSEAAAANTGFGRFIASLAGAADRQARVDEFMARHETLPIVEGNLVHFVYRGEAKDVAIAGSMLDGSRPEPMRRVEGTDLYHRTFRLQPSSRIEYQFQVDLDRWETDPHNPRTAPGTWGDQEMSELILPGFEIARHAEEPKGTERGRIEAFKYTTGEDGAEREVKVYLPHGYDDAPERRYPLLVVQEGSDWLDKGRLANTLDNLIGRSVAPVVVVFIDPIGQWWLEAGGSQTAQFATMLSTYLVPALEHAYRLNAAPKSRAIMGTRDYGLAAAYTALKHPDVFGKAAIQSAGMQNGAQVELYEMLRRRPPARVRFYVDWNLYESRSVDRGVDFEADTRSLVSALEAAGYTYSGGEARDAHGWSSWRSRSDRILKTFFPLRGGHR